MRIYHLFIVTNALAFALTALLISVYAQAPLDLYFTFYLAEFLVISLLFAQVNTEARRVLGRLSMLGVPFFALIIIYRALQMLPIGLWP